MTEPAPEPEPDAEERSWHRRFAARCNNRAWALSVQDRSAAEDRAMLDLAHASAWHWGQVGGELERMRATMLLAEVHAALGLGTTAFASAEAMRAYFLGRPDTPDWELAFTHVVHAHAAHAAGRAAQHRDSHARAVAALQAVADAEDRRIVAATFDRVPAP